MTDKLETNSDLPEEIDLHGNQTVLAYLQGRSCHSDIAIPFEHSAHAAMLGIYCSNPKHYGYLVAHRQGHIVAFAEGMNGVSIKLPEEEQAILHSLGAKPIPILPGWLHIPLYGPHHFEKGLDSLMQKAVSEIGDAR